MDIWTIHNSFNLWKSTKTTDTVQAVLTPHHSKNKVCFSTFLRSSKTSSFSLHGFMVSNTVFNIMSVISRRPVHLFILSYLVSVLRTIFFPKRYIYNRLKKNPASLYLNSFETKDVRWVAT